MHPFEFLSVFWVLTNQKPGSAIIYSEQYEQMIEKNTGYASFSCIVHILYIKLMREQ